MYVLFLFIDQVCKCVLKKSESIYKQNSLFKEVIPHWCCDRHNSICYYCAQKPCLQGNGVNIYTILFTVFSRHNCLIVTWSWCEEMWQYSDICFLNVLNYNWWALLTPTGENKITCAKVYCGVCNFRRLQFSLRVWQLVS